MYIDKVTFTRICSSDCGIIDNSIPSKRKIFLCNGVSKWDSFLFRLRDRLNASVQADLPSCAHSRLSVSLCTGVAKKNKSRSPRWILMEKHGVSTDVCCVSLLKYRKFVVVISISEVPNRSIFEVHIRQKLTQTICCVLLFSSALLRWTKRGRAIPWNKGRHGQASSDPTWPPPGLRWTILSDWR